MHDDEVGTDAELVRRLVAAQFPQWADLPVERFPSPGTVNAVYRLGDELSVRLPLVERSVGDVRKEQEWLPRLAPLLPVPIPVVVGAGVPGEGFPFPWSVCRWLPGDNPEAGRGAAPLVAGLAAFVTAMRRAGLPGGPRAYRGVPLSEKDAAARRAIADLEALNAEPGPVDPAAAHGGPAADHGDPSDPAAAHGGPVDTIDTAALTAAWDLSVKTPAWAGPPVWVHSDLMPGNLLVSGDGRLTGVIDFATAGVGDPACDLMPAWNLLPASARPAFREALGTDDDTWARGRGWALVQALVALPYYLHTNPAMAANARYVLREVLADMIADGSLG
ncbi:aminoglycoside phosphotransferase family protein [Nonomuraea sp. NPDC050783]|uniref:aminoglycoside phosphotransferase family protein n=1 Tax=Nonomuraea sp. NPDC050783 TaxID=3154634 RepID=UPI003465355A